MPREKVTIIGSYLSPYVRKVLAACAYKGIEVAIDPLVPLNVVSPCRVWWVR